MTGVSSGQKATSASINAFFGLILSSPFTQRANNNTAANVTATGFATPSQSCTATVTSAGTTALVKISALLQSAAGPIICRGAVAVSGATTVTAATNLANGFILQQDLANPQMFTAMDVIPISPGTNTYTLQYLTVSGTAVVSVQSILVIAP